MQGLVFQLSLRNKIIITVLWIEIQTPLQRKLYDLFCFCGSSATSAFVYIPSISVYWKLLDEYIDQRELKSFWIKIRGLLYLLAIKH